MTRKTKFINADRRRFVQSSAIVGTVAATGASLSEAAVEAPGAATLSETTKVHAGYQLTDRVKEYYRKARF